MLATATTGKLELAFTLGFLWTCRRICGASIVTGLLTLVVNVITGMLLLASLSFTWQLML